MFYHVKIACYQLYFVFNNCPFLAYQADVMPRDLDEAFEHGLICHILVNQQFGHKPNSLPSNFLVLAFTTYQGH